VCGPLAILKYNVSNAPYFLLSARLLVSGSFLFSVEALLQRPHADLGTIVSTARSQIKFIKSSHSSAQVTSEARADSTMV